MNPQEAEYYIARSMCYNRLGKTKEEILELATIFSEMVQGQKDERQDQLGDAAFLSGVAKFPQRIKCATLAWNALKKTIEDQENK